MLFPTLEKICCDLLVTHRQHLGDVGWIPVQSLRKVLFHCNEEELARIEDETREGSGRDLSWYTWDFWWRQYERVFGMNRAEKTALKPLQGTQPSDYSAPVNVTAATADWRAMLARDRDEESARAAAISGRLRSLYSEADAVRSERKVGVCIIKPPAKRMRTISGPGPAGAFRSSGGGAAAATPAERAKSKMLVDIGLAKKGSPPAMKMLGGGGGSRGGVKVTRKVVVHKAGQPPAAGAPGAGGQPRPVSRLLAVGPPASSPNKSQPKGQAGGSTGTSTAARPAGKAPTTLRESSGLQPARKAENSGAGSYASAVSVGMSYDDQRARLKAAMASSIAKELAGGASLNGAQVSSTAQHAAGKKRPAALRDDDFGI